MNKKEIEVVVGKLLESERKKITIEIVDILRKNNVDNKIVDMIEWKYLRRY